MIRRRLTAVSRAGVLTLFLGVLVGPAMASAAAISMSVHGPAEVEVGSVVELAVAVHADGEPAVGAMVVLSYTASIAGVQDWVELDRSVVDDTGAATLSYVQRAASNGEMRVEYVGADGFEIEPLLFTISVLPGGEQQHRSSVGVPIPWLNGSAVVGLVILLWSILTFAAYQLVKVSRGGRVEASPTHRARRRPHGETGAISVGTILAVVAAITGIGMVVVTLRNPLTHANLDSPEGYTRTPVAELDREFHYTGPGLDDPQAARSGDSLSDGRLLWLQAGCAGCHGLRAGGAAVGPDMSDLGSPSRFLSEVRDGPDNMPAYVAEVLTDTEVEKIHAWLEAHSP